MSTVNHDGNDTTDYPTAHQTLHTMTTSTDPRNDTGLLAFIVRDLMAAANYVYVPDRPLIDQAMFCAELIRNTRDELHHAITDREEAFQEHAAEIQRLTDLTAELRKQLTSALKLARDHGAQIEPWDFPEPIAATTDNATYSAFREDGGS